MNNNIESENSYMSGRKLNFFMADNDILFADLTNNEKLVCLVLCYCNNNEQVAFPSYETISKRASVSIKTAKTVVDSLIQKGFIIKNKE